MERLGDYVNIRTGKLDANAADENGLYPFFTCAIEPLKINTYKYDCECVLVAGNGDLNVKYYKGKFEAYQRTYIIESKDHDKLSVRYLYYFLDGYVETLRKQSIGGVIKYIKLNNLTDARIPIPSLEKQNEIVAILDKTEEVFSKRKQQLEKLDMLVKARFVEMFGDIISNTKKWPVYEFCEITESRLGKMLDSKKNTGKNTFPYLANYNVQWFKFEMDKLNKMDFDEKDQVEFELRDGDLLVCEGGEVGRCAVWHNEVQPCFFQKALHRVRCNMEIIHPDYLAWWFKFRSEYNEFEDIVGSKSTIAHLPGAKIKKLQVVVPPIDLQNEFASIKQGIQKTRRTIEKSIEKLETLKKALMQKYFG